MQRLTKYRLVVGVLALASVGLGTYSFMLQHSASDLRFRASQAQERAQASERKLADRDATIERLKHQVASTGTDQSTMKVAIGAFARQAEVCEALKQQLHVKE